MLEDIEQTVNAAKQVNSTYQEAEDRITGAGRSALAAHGAIQAEEQAIEEAKRAE